MKELRVSRAPSATSRYRDTSSKVGLERSDTGQQSWSVLGAKSIQGPGSHTGSLESVSDIRDVSGGSASELQQSLERESVHRERAEEELDKVRSLLAEKDIALTSLKDTLQTLQNDHETLKETLTQEQVDHQKLKNERGNMKAQLEETTSKLRLKEQTAQTLRIELRKLTKERKMLDEDLKTVKFANGTLSKQKDSLCKKIQSLEEAKSKTKVDADTFGRQTILLSRELEVVRKDLEIVSKSIAETKRENNTLKKKLQRSSADLKQIERNWKNKEQELVLKSKDLEAGRKEMAKLQKNLEESGKERERCLAEIGNRDLKLKDIQAEVTIRENAILQREKQLEETQRHYLELLQKNEVLSREKDTIGRQLLERKEAAFDLTQQAKLAMKQSEVLQDISKRQEAEMWSKQREAREARAQKGELAGELQQQRILLELGKQRLAETEGKIRELLKNDDDAEKIKAEHAKDMRKIQQEKQRLSAELASKNEECSSLSERLRILSIKADNAQHSLEDSQRVVRRLRHECDMGRRHSATLGKRLQVTQDLRKELFQAHAQLLREQKKTKALEEELETPLNIHRWRLLQGSDPNKSVLVEKVLSLQELVIKRTLSAGDSQLRLREKEELLDRMRNRFHLLSSSISSTEGSDLDPARAQHKLALCQKQLSERNDQVKSINAEVNMYSSFLSAYENEISRLSEELKDVKMKHLAQKKEESMARMKVKALEKKLKETEREDDDKTLKAEDLRVRPATTGTRRRIKD